MTYLTGLYKNESNSKIQETLNITTNEETLNITTNEETLTTEKEVKVALQKLKNRKYPRENEIAIELLNYEGWLNNSPSYNRIPDEWRRAIMILMHKSGVPKEPDSYLGINLPNTQSTPQRRKDK